MGIRDSLNSFLPGGIKLLQYKILFAKVPSLAATLNLAEYEIHLTGITIQQADIEEWLHKDEIVVSRMVRDETQEINIRPYVDKISLGENKLTIRTRTIEGRTARVQEILNTLLDSVDIRPQNFRIQRTGQFREEGGRLLTPFDEGGWTG
ncbi:MAG: DUF2344 domain-containing protein [Calditrichia bacterium]